MVIAHVAGVPVEEFLPSAAGAGAGLLVARAWLAVHLRRQSSGGDRSEPDHREIEVDSTAGSGKAG
jgi:hypothetical protein